MGKVPNLTRDGRGCPLPDDLGAEDEGRGDGDVAEADGQLENGGKFTIGNLESSFRPHTASNFCLLDP